MGAFQAHLKDTIALNSQRKPIYGELSAGKSLPLSRSLIRVSRSIIPFAKRIDRHGKRLNKRGIPILQQDFVPFQGLPDPETKPLHAQILSKSEARQLKKELKKWIKEVNKLRSNRELWEICERSEHMLAQIKEWEENHDCHLSMTRYLTESMAYTAFRGLRYLNYQSSSILLSSRLIKGHLFFMPWAIPFDRKAQHIQSMGIGFLVNDFPQIPFLEEWEEDKYKSWSK